MKVYFLEGHGEPTIGTGTPLGVFKDYIERQNVSAMPLSFASWMQCRRIVLRW